MIFNIYEFWFGRFMRMTLRAGLVFWRVQRRSSQSDGRDGLVVFSHWLLRSHAGRCAGLAEGRDARWTSGGGARLHHTPLCSTALSLAAENTFPGALNSSLQVKTSILNLSRPICLCVMLNMTQSFLMVYFWSGRQKRLVKSRMKSDQHNELTVFRISTEGVRLLRCSCLMSLLQGWVGFAAVSELTVRFSPCVTSRAARRDPDISQTFWRSVAQFRDRDPKHHTGCVFCSSVWGDRTNERTEMFLRHPAEVKRWVADREREVQ